VLHALESLPPLPEHWRDLVAFTAAYYQRGIGEVALSVLPPELRKLDDAQVRQRIARLQKALAAAPAPVAAGVAAPESALLSAPQPLPSFAVASWRGWPLSAAPLPSCSCRSPCPHSDILRVPPRL
jgi:primosomal protein N' (replication factor Y)